MKTTLLLTDEAEISRLMLNDPVLDELPVRHTEAHAGCTCDRWGHPCPKCIDRDIVRKAEHPVSSLVGTVR
jgi:hypothetical protein